MHLEGRGTGGREGDGISGRQVKRDQTIRQDSKRMNKDYKKNYKKKRPPNFCHPS